MRVAALVAATILLAGCSSGERAPVVQVIEGGEVGDVFFLDALRGWVVGSERKSGNLFIAATEDGGRSWATTRLENKSRGFPNLTGVAFRDMSRGWAFGTHALALSTRDGGKTWAKETAPGDIRTFRYRNGTGSLVLGPPGYSGRDGFFTFDADDFQSGRLREKASNDFNMFPHDVQIVNPRTLWGFGDGSLYRSTDSGDSWTVIRIDEAYSGPSTIGDGVRAISFLSATTGFIVVGDRLLATTDGGATRKVAGPLGAGGFVHSRLFFFDEARGVALGSTRAAGTILFTADGGRTWSKAVDLGPGEWSRLFVLDDTQAWAAGVVDGNVVIRQFSAQ